MAKRSIIYSSNNSHQSRSTNSVENGLAPRSHSLTDPNRQSGTSPTDLVFENHFSVFLIRPVSPAGQSWLDENVGDENTLTFGGAVVCEPRYVEAIVLGAQSDGLVV